MYKINLMEIEEKSAINRECLFHLTEIIPVGETSQMVQQRGPVITVIKSAARDSIQTKSNNGNIRVLSCSRDNVYDFEDSDRKQIEDPDFSMSKYKIMTAPSGMNSRPFAPLINPQGDFNDGEGNRWTYDEGATIISLETTKRNLLNPDQAKESNYPYKLHSKAGQPTLKAASATFRDTVAATVARVLNSSFGHCVLNGDFLQGLCVLMLFLPRVTITRIKAPGGIASCSRAKVFMGLSVSINKSNDQKQ